MRQTLLSICLALCCSGVAFASTDRLPPGGVLLVAEPAQDAAAVEALVALVATQRADEALVQLVSMPDPAMREAQAARLLERLHQDGVPVPDTFLSAIGQWPVLVYRRHEETRADWFHPVYDLPTQVQSLRRQAARAAAVDTLLAAFQGGSLDARAKALSAADPQVIAAAVRRAPPHTLQAVHAQAKAGGTALPGVALAALAARLRTQDSMLDAIAAADAVDVLPLFANTVPSMLPADALAVLHAAMSQPEYASVAATALAGLPRSPGVDAAVADALAQPATAASMTAAFARQPDGLARIDAWLAGGTSDDPAAAARALTHLALALRLQGGPDAERRLAALREDPRLPAHVRTELQR